MFKTVTKYLMVENPDYKNFYLLILRTYNTLIIRKKMELEGIRCEQIW